MSSPLGYIGAKSVCQCEHLGDGSNSEHNDTIDPGHGSCKIPGCGCKKFSWKRFTMGFQEFLTQCGIVEKRS